MGRFEQLKKTLQNEMPQGFHINVFLMTEMTLTILEYFSPESDAGKAYLLLHNYGVIGNIQNPAETAFLQKAHLCLRQCSSKQNWQQLLEQYQDVRLDRIRRYTLVHAVCDGKPILKLIRNPETTIAPERTEIYLEHIREFQEKHRTNYAKEGRYQYWLGDEEDRWAEVKLPPRKPMRQTEIHPRNERPAIEVSISELTMSAEEMRRILPYDHCADTLKTNSIKTVSGKQVIPAEKLTIQETVNLVGMVGSGKSTLMKILSYHLAKRGKKIVLVLDTVADTLSLYAYFHSLHLNVSPLIGTTERMKYIHQVMEQDAMYLKPEYSEYLTAPCLISGMTQGSETASKFGGEPCTKLKKDKKNYTCPYLDVCPAAKMYRDALTSDIVVTTVAGLTAVRIPGENRLYLEHVLERADLVVFDECDKVQRTLDAFFTPSTAFMEFIHQSADYCRSDMKQEADQLDRVDHNMLRFSELRLQSLAMSKRVRECIQSVTGSWETLLRNTFSSMTLWRQMVSDREKCKFPIPESVLELLKTAMDETKDEELDTIIDYARERQLESKFNRKLISWLQGLGYQPDAETLQHIKLYLVVVSFDKYVKSLEEAYTFLTEEQKSEMELFNFLQARFTAQQKLLPSAVMGNLFGMKNDPKKGLQLYRQYAFGRALMNRLPWLKMTEDGKPAGPHVLLMSGSSWAKGCLEYHVNVPVQYLLEAEEWKRQKLAETRFVDLNTGVRVSGGGQEERAEHLRQVIQKSMDAVEGELTGGRKILMIVNSYREAIHAVRYLNQQLQDENAKAACMVRSIDEYEHEISPEYRILRGDLARFHTHPARILVAPAQAIERGYNIVDEGGHSSFGSVFFLVRPMAVPDEISSKCAKLNGIIEAYFCQKDSMGAFAKAKCMRHYAAQQWHIMEEQSKRSLKYLNDTMQTDVTAGLFILILQIFGRLARITDSLKAAPSVYFADGAFRTNPEQPNAYDCLNALRDYLEKMMQDEAYGEIAKTLYWPFYEAFVKGVNENVYDIPYGDDSEIEYDF